MSEVFNALFLTANDGDLGGLSPEMKSALISSCALNIPATDSGSILGNGRQVLQLCLVEIHPRKCLALDRRQAAGTKINIGFTCTVMNLNIRILLYKLRPRAVRFRSWTENV